MIDLGFLNLILIIANNAFGFREPDNLDLSALIATGIHRCSTLVVLSSFHSFALVISGSPPPFVPVKSSDPNNFMADFLVNIFVNPFGNLDVDASSNHFVDLVFSLAILFFSNFPALSQCL